jgi:Na+/H+ antiporter NhaD/arsenite permease-like protein
MMHLLPLLPFVIMLAAIALMPLAAPIMWDKNRNKLLVALSLALPAAVHLLWNGAGAALAHTLLYDYVPFMVLVTALFVITGGIFVDGDIEATPLVNTGFLALGAVLASFMGTTGASMLLIRPVLHTNKERQRTTHTVLFFIAIVANCGGLLTPLGDPPLFMLYLRGAPFAWFLGLWPVWLFVNAVLLSIYFLLDTYHHRHESRESLAADKENIKPISVEGAWNLAWLAGVLLAVALVNEHNLAALFASVASVSAVTAAPMPHWFGFLREAMIAFCALGAWVTTKHITRVANGFTWHPIEEVAALFLGIFVTMTPCVLFLQANAANLANAGVASPVTFYYASGLLSSMLDNAPTAVTFHSLAAALPSSIAGGSSTFSAALPLVAGAPEALVRAIALASVLFGAMTYIGNGPNLLIKSIAENNNVPMPHFFAYVLRFSLLVLLPVFVLAQVLFVR